MSDSRLWVMVSQDYAKPNRTWQKIKKKIDWKIKNNKVTEIVEILSYIYTIIIIITTYTFVDLVIQKFQKSTPEEYCASKNIKLIFSPIFILDIPFFCKNAKLSFNTKTVFIKFERSYRAAC